MLGASRQLTLDSVENNRGSRAFVLVSAPASLNRAAAGFAEGCASAIRGTIFIDAETSFPIRVDAIVADDGMCSAKRNMPLDDTGTREQWHFLRLQRKDPCSNDTKDIWVMDQAVSFSRIHLPEYRAFVGNPIAERAFQLSPGYVGGVFINRTLRSKFQVFVTGACIRFGDVVEAPLVESVHSTIQFDLRDVPFREGGGKVP
jgi:hypothetical protein